MTAAEQDKLLTLAATVRKKNGDEAAVQLLIAAGIPEPFAWEKLRRLTTARRPKETTLAKLLVLPKRKSAPVERRCMIIAPVEQGGSKAENEEVCYLRDEIIRIALETLPYRVIWKRQSATKILQEISLVDLVIVVLSPSHLATFHQLGIAQAYGKPVLSLMAAGCRLPAGLAIDTIIYPQYSRRTGLAPRVKEKLISDLRQRACSIGAASPRWVRPLREFRSRFSLGNVYDGKMYALTQLWNSVVKVAEEMELDYELSKLRKPDALGAIADLMVSVVEIFAEQCDCLHETVVKAKPELAAADWRGCEEICRAMKGLADQGEKWVKTLQRDLKQADIRRAQRQLSQFIEGILSCRDLLLARKQLISRFF